MISIYNEYIEAKNNTYLIIECYHKHSLETLFKHTIKFKDLHMLKMIYNDPYTTIQDIIASHHISSTNLSNRFAMLEDSGFIVRQKNDDDSRKVDVFLTAKGRDVIVQYNQYIGKMMDYIGQHMSKKELKLFLKYLVKLNNNMFTSNKKISLLQVASNPKSIYYILEDIENYLISNENNMLFSNNNAVTYDQAFLMTEIYLNQLTVNVSLPTLADNLFICYQTIVSKINKLISLGYMSKAAKGEYAFDPSIQQLLNNFISVRVINYYKLIRHSTYEEETVLFKAFSLLKDYSLTIK